MKLVISSNGFYPSALLIIKLVEANSPIIKSWPEDDIEKSNKFFRLPVLDVDSKETGFYIHSLLAHSIKRDGVVYQMSGADKFRSDPDLIRYVEELGKHASHPDCPFYIVDIPDNINWYINDVFGREEICERARVWDHTGLKRDI